PTEHHRLSWAYMDGLPKWRHLKHVREDAGHTDGHPPASPSRAGIRPRTGTRPHHLREPRDT
ncbi:hypothetical protein ACWDCZ_38725, partial [Kitasatospora sp. NPDC001225]